MVKISREECLGMLRNFRNARYKSFADAEENISIIHCVEQLGSLLCKSKKKKVTLGDCEDCMKKFVKDNHKECKRWETLYKLVRNSRNDLVHEGAAARQLNKWLVEMCIVLEEALTNAAREGEQSMTAEDLMVRGVVVAECWEELATVRNKMLALSFSYLPTYWDENEGWYLIRDSDVARFFRYNPKGSNGRSARRTKVKDVLGQMRPKKAIEVACSTEIHEIFDDILEQPVLVVEEKRPLGILSAFDLLSTIDSILPINSEAERRLRQRKTDSC